MRMDAGERPEDVAVEMERIPCEIQTTTTTTTTTASVCARKAAAEPDQDNILTAGAPEAICSLPALTAPSPDEWFPPKSVDEAAVDMLGDEADTVAHLSGVVDDILDTNVEDYANADPVLETLPMSEGGSGLVPIKKDDTESETCAPSPAADDLLDNDAVLPAEGLIVDANKADTLPPKEGAAELSTMIGVGDGDKPEPLWKFTDPMPMQWSSLPPQKSPSPKGVCRSLDETITDNTLDLAFRALNDRTGSAVVLASMASMSRVGSSFNDGDGVAPGGDSTSGSDDGDDDDGSYSSGSDDDNDKDGVAVEWGHGISPEYGHSITTSDKNRNDNDDSTGQKDSPPLLTTPPPSPKSPPAISRLLHPTTGELAAVRRSYNIRQQTPSPQSRLLYRRNQAGDLPEDQMAKSVVCVSFDRPGSIGSDEKTNMTSNTWRSSRLKTLILVPNQRPQYVANCKSDSNDSWEVSMKGDEDEEEETALTAKKNDVLMNVDPRIQSRFPPRLATTSGMEILWEDDTAARSLGYYSQDDTNTVISFNTVFSSDSHIPICGLPALHHSHGYSSTSKRGRRAEGCCALMPPQDVQDEITGTIEDVGLAWDQVWNAFTLRGSEIDSLAGTLGKAKRDVRRMHARETRAVLMNMKIW